MSKANMNHLFEIAHHLGVEPTEILALGNRQPETEEEAGAARLRKIAAALLDEANRMERLA